MDAIQLPGVTLPTTFGQPAQPVPPGQLVQALVLELIESNVFRLQLPQAVVDVRSDVPLTPGTTITLAAKGASANARLVIYADAPQPAGQGAPASSARQPIGEATIIARVPTATTNRVGQPTTLVVDAPPIVPARAPDASPRAVSPELALAEAVRGAAVRQSGAAPLFADAEQIVARPELPAPVRAAAADVLSLRVPLDEKLTAADVKQAFARSGVLFEPRLAVARNVAPADAEILTPAPASDLKAALLVLRQVAKVWSASEPAPSRTAATPLPVVDAVPTAMKTSDVVKPAIPGDAIRPLPAGEAMRPMPASETIRHVANALAGMPDEVLPQAAPLSPEQATKLAKSLGSMLEAPEPHAPPTDARANAALPPPYRGAPLAAQAPAAPSIMPDATPHDMAEKLVAAADGALARTTLLQAASLPEQPQAQRVDMSQRWTFEVPFATPHGTALAQFEVSRDPQPAKADAQARTWRARFSIDVEPMGPVHAMVAIVGERASVTLWAERHATASQLSNQSAALSEALRAAELEPADFQFRVGAPPAVAKQAAPGRFMDRAS